MLARARRVTRPDDFRRILRYGRKAGARRLVVHLLGDADPVTAPARAGLVVGRGVGVAVVRHRVSRRLRHVLRDRLDALPGGTAVVVRALPPAGVASSAQLAQDLDTALRRLRSPADQERKR